jgi:hypothetical protein
VVQAARNLAAVGKQYAVIRIQMSNQIEIATHQARRHPRFLKRDRDTLIAFDMSDRRRHSHAVASENKACWRATTDDDEHYVYAVAL